MQQAFTRWLKFWCQHCKIETAHEYLSDVQGDGGLVWKCERCRRSASKTAHQASLGQKVR